LSFETLEMLEKFWALNKLLAGLVLLGSSLTLPVRLNFGWFLFYYTFLPKSKVVLIVLVGAFKNDDGVNPPNILGYFYFYFY